jgi:hypothetical protein
VHTTAAQADIFESVAHDVRAAARIQELDVVEGGDELRVELVFADAAE